MKYMDGGVVPLQCQNSLKPEVAARCQPAYGGIGIQKTI